MSTTRINFRDISANRSNFYKRRIKAGFTSKRAEFIAWILFFGIGVAYFVTSLVIAIV